MDLSSIGRQYGLDPAQTEAAVAALAPVIAAGFKSKSSSGDGLGSIFAALQQDEERGQIASPTDAGNVVLSQIFGSKDVSRGVAQQLSANSGISSAILKQLLPVIAAYFVSQMMSGKGAAAATGSGGGLGDILGQVLGGGQGSGGWATCLAACLVARVHRPGARADRAVASPTCSAACWGAARRKAAVPASATFWARYSVAPAVPSRRAPPTIFSPACRPHCAGAEPHHLPT